MKSVLYYTNKEKTIKKETNLSYDEFLSLKTDLDKINEYIKIIYLNSYYLESADIYRKYDFNTPAPDVTISTYYNIVISAMYNNLELWDAFIKRKFSTYDDLVIEGKSISRIIDSEYYDSHIEYVVFKQIRNRLTHCELPYSDMLVYDDYTRHYVIYTKDILNDKHSKSARDYLEKDSKEFYDLNIVIDRCLVYLEEINNKIYKILLEKFNIDYTISIQNVINKIGFDYDYVYLIWSNDDVDEMSIFKVEHIEIPLPFLKSMKEKI